MYRFFFKPSFDYFFSFALILLLSPIFILMVCTLGLTQGEVFFVQERTGLKGNRFRLFKFASMVVENEELKLTGIGALIRRTSIDEWPQLLNVLKGEMSLVGPRPLLPEYEPLYDREQERRHEVRPGITGWAQVHGGKSLSWPDKFKLDLYYVDHLSASLDFVILIKTIGALIEQQDGPDEKFKGNI